MQRYRDKKIRVPFAKNCKVNKENGLIDLRKNGEGGGRIVVYWKRKHN